VELPRNRSSRAFLDRFPLLLRFAVALLLVVAALVIKLLITPAGQRVETPFLLFFSAIMVSAWFGGFGPGLAATLVATLFCDYLFLPPLGSLGDTEPQHRLRLALFLIEGTLVSALVGGLRVALTLEEQAHTRAEEALALRDNFLSIASHELKTPLTLLLGNAQLLQRRLTRAGELDARDDRALRAIVDQAARMNAMIDSLLDLSRLHHGKLLLAHTSVCLRTLVQQQVEALRPTLEQHTIDVVAPEQPLLVDGDPLRLEQVLQNLIQNAIKYSPGGGRIELLVERRNADAAVSVTDHGIGIPPEALASIFRRFYRASNASGFEFAGMGVGLFLVREIVALHGGAVEVSSVEGYGSTFTIVLPLAAP
jgi:signal transduction histidine kinase